MHLNTEELVKNGNSILIEKPRDEYTLFAASIAF